MQSGESCRQDASKSESWPSVGERQMSADGKFQDKRKVQDKRMGEKEAEEDDEKWKVVGKLTRRQRIGAQHKAQQIRPLQAPYCSRQFHATQQSSSRAARLLLVFVTCYALLVVRTLATTSHDNRQQAHHLSSSASSNERGNEVIVSSGVDQVRPRRHAHGRPTPPTTAGPLRQRPSAQVASAAPPATSGDKSALGNRQQAARGQNLGVVEAADNVQLASRAAVSVKNVTAQNGQSVVLHCIVEPNELGDIPSVSWFRGSGELQLLTFETTTIIPDERFVVHRGLKRENDWALQIKDLNRSTDSGLYQCQTSGDSSPQLQAYQLNVVEPQVSILGSPDLAVKLGAPINLTCVISQSPDQLQFVFWYRDERMINYDLGQPDERGKILMAKLVHKPDTITSNLRIFSARPSDSGNYTCMPSGARPNSIYVHVLEASDKRLIMFQNDDNHQLLAASSQQTTSSAISRLSRGRAYAILVAYLIIASWLQLLAQVQTGVSLALVAIIGLLLGRYRRAPAELKRGRRVQEQPGDESSKFQLLDSSTACERDHNLDSPTSTTSDAAAKSTHERRLSTNDEDPLLEGANTALHLLQTLTSAAASRPHQDAQHQELELRPHERHSFGPAVRLAKRQLQQLTLTDEARQEIARRLVATAAAHQSATPSTRNRPAPRDEQQQQPQSSPSGSSSCASTGYNSDTRTAHSTAPNSATPPSPSVNLLTSGGVGRCSCKAKCVVGCECSALECANTRTIGRDYSKQTANKRMVDEDELEMIELLREQPSAMRLIIEQLRNSAGGAQSSCSLAGECRINRRPAGADYNNKLASDWSSLERVTARCPNKRLDCHSSSMFFGRSLVANEPDDTDESIYSIPRGQEAPSGATSGR